MRNRTFQFQTRPSRGFTLIELLISMGLVMILTLGINQVFSMATNTIGMGNRVNEMTRDSRATVAALQQDLSRWATDSPIFYIQTQYVVTQSKDKYGNWVVVSDRRVDTMGFFARGDYRRVTADARKISSPTRSTEAWTWIGHCTTEDYYHSVFTLSDVLGKQVILLKDPELLTDEMGNPLEAYIQRANVAAKQANGTTVKQYLPNLSPLNGFSISTDNGILPNSPVYSSRYDLAGTTIEQFRADLAMINPDFTTPNAPWYEKFNLMYRFQCNPTPLHIKNVNHVNAVNPFFTAENIAKATPALISNCSDFIIDFSGDYTTQNPDGTIKTFVPDGIIDFVYDNTTGAKTARWYGLGKRIGNPNDPSRGNMDPGVLNLWTPAYLKTSGVPEDPNYFVRGPLETGSGAPVVALTTDPYTRNRILTTTFNYLWVNGRGLPKQVRISFRQTDPEGRIQVGPWTQFTAGPR